MRADLKKVFSIERLIMSPSLYCRNTAGILVFLVVSSVIISIRYSLLGSLSLMITATAPAFSALIALVRNEHSL
jgi:hypothetical protein